MAFVNQTPFDAKADAKLLRKAMKGFGCDEGAVIGVVCGRTSRQRQELIQVYKQMHGRELIADLKSELSGKLKYLIVGLMTPIPVYLAQEVKRAIKGLGTNESVLIEIICTRTNQEIIDIKNSYQKLYKTSMEEDVKSELSGDLKRLMVALMTASRPQDNEVNLSEARKEAKELKAAGVDRWGTDEGAFITALCSNNFAQTRAIFTEYRNLAGHDILDALDKEMSGDLKTACVTVVKAVCNTPRYFAERLEQAMRGFGTDDKTLIRIIISRSEIDLPSILEEYQRVFGMSLVKAIQKETSGDYQRALMIILTGSPTLYT